MCFEETAAREPGSAKPLAMPDRSMSHAAESFTRGSGLSSGGTAPAAPASRASTVARGSGETDQRGASFGSSAANRAETIGLVKNDPALTESGSSESTMPFDARSASTDARTSSSGTRVPSSTPSAVASCW